MYSRNDVEIKNPIELVVRDCNGEYLFSGDLMIDDVECVRNFLDEFTSTPVLDCIVLHLGTSKLRMIRDIVKDKGDSNE